MITAPSHILHNGLTSRFSHFRYNLSSLASIALASLFIMYVILFAVLPHTEFFRALIQLSVVFIIIVPIAAFILSLISLRQINEHGGGGATLSYVALSITLFYFVVGLSFGIIFLGLILLYTFIL
jgi:hypothetical protein